MIFGQIHIADIGQALGTQEFLENLRGDAGSRVFFEADRGDFRRRLGSNRFSTSIEARGAQPREARGACHCDIGQEVTSALHDRHGMSPWMLCPGVWCDDMTVTSLSDNENS